MPKTKATNTGVSIRWSEGMPLCTKATAGQYFWDEKPIPDPSDATKITNYPPEYFDMSARWVVTVIGYSRLSARTRASTWPSVFTSKGLIMSYEQKGEPSKLKSQGNLVYALVFNRFLMVGVEGGNVVKSEQSKSQALSAGVVPSEVACIIPNRKYNSLDWYTPGGQNLRMNPNEVHAAQEALTQATPAGEPVQEPIREPAKDPIEKTAKKLKMATNTTPALNTGSAAKDPSSVTLAVDFLKPSVPGMKRKAKGPHIGDPYIPKKVKDLQSIEDVGEALFGDNDLENFEHNPGLDLRSAFDLLDTYHHDVIHLYSAYRDIVKLINMCILPLAAVIRSTKSFVPLYQSHPDWLQSLGPYNGSQGLVKHLLESSCIPAKKQFEKFLLEWRDHRMKGPLVDMKIDMKDLGLEPIEGMTVLDGLANRCYENHKAKSGTKKGEESKDGEASKTGEN